MFDFTAEDLRANQRGSISSRQKEWLQMTARGVRSFSWKGTVFTIAFAFLGLCIILTMYLQNEGSRTALFSNPVNLLMFPVIGIIVLGILALTIFLNYRNANKLENSVLSSASGAIRFDQDSSGESGLTSYYVFVGKKRFTFADSMNRVFTEGEKYKVYYCKAGVYEFVMSYEQIT